MKKEERGRNQLKISSCDYRVTKQRIQNAMNSFSWVEKAIKPACKHADHLK